MYNKVLVPLDGSDLAELALPHLVEIAAGCHIPDVFLVSATEHLKGRVAGAWLAEETSAREIHVAPDTSPLLIGSSYTGALYSSDSSRLKNIPADMGRMAKTALNYLIRKSAELETKGLHVELRVLVGNPADEIIGFAREQQIDLIVMAASNKSGLGRWDTASIADKIAKDCDIPVLLVKPNPGFKETRPRRHGQPT
jgi:nucleotide-binding universal stress UspA family protein